MKNLVILIFAFFLCVKAKSQHHFTFEGTSPKSLENSVIHLRIYDFYSKNPFNIIDSTTIKNGKFTFKGVIRKPAELANIYNTSGNFNFVINSGLNICSLNERLFQSKIANSPSNNLKNKVDSIRTQFMVSYGKSVSRNSSAKFLESDKERGLFTEQLKLLSQHPDDYYSLIQIYEISRMGSMLNTFGPPLTAFQKLSFDLQRSPLGEEFYAVHNERLAAYNASKIGQLIQNFSVKNNKGKVFKNNTLSGKPYVIAFSATWCIPCQLYQKTLLRLYHKYRPQGLEVIYFNLDDDAVKWNKHIKEKKLDWINVSENTKFRDSEIAKQFNVQAIPLYLIVDKKGKIIYNADEFKDDNYDKLEEYIKLAVAK